MWKFFIAALLGTSSCAALDRNAASQPMESWFGLYRHPATLDCLRLHAGTGDEVMVEVLTRRPARLRSLGARARPPLAPGDGRRHARRGSWHSHRAHRRSAHHRRATARERRQLTVLRRAGHPRRAALHEGRPRLRWRLHRQRLELIFEHDGTLRAACVTRFVERPARHHDACRACVSERFSLRAERADVVVEARRRTRRERLLRPDGVLAASARRTAS